MKINKLFRSLIIITIISFSYSLVAYDCSSTKAKISEISLVDAERCSPDAKNITTTEKIIQLIQPLVFQELNYFQCLIEIEHLTLRCGRSIDTLFSSALQEELFEISKTDCLRLINEGIFHYQGKNIIVDKRLNLNFVSLETIGSVSGGSCTPGPPTLVNNILYDRPIRTSKFRILTKKGKGTIDLEESKMITEDGTSCNYHDEYCFTASGGNTYWNPIFYKNTCSTGQYIPIYQGPATEVREYYKGKETISFILHYDKYDFQVILTGKKTITCGLISYLTEHPKLSIIIKDPELPFTLEYDNKGLGKNINMMTYLNTKLVYTVKHVKDQIESLYEKLMYTRCLAENKLIHSILSSALIAPHEFAYQYSKQEGHTASLRGEVIYVMKCEPVSVNFTTNLLGECYNEIPVSYKGQQMFMSPRSRLLSNIGTKVECSNVLPVKYKIMDFWYILNPSGLIPSNPPKMMSMVQAPEWDFKEIDNLASAGIYTQEDLDKIDKIILTSVRSEAIKSQITRAIVGEGKMTDNLQITNLMTPEELERFSKSKLNMFFESIYKKLGFFGNIISSIIGAIIILKGFLFIINSVISLRLLHGIFGYSWKLLFFWWDHLVNILIHNEKGDKKLNKSQKLELRSLNQEISTEEGENFTYLFENNS